jgi:nucleoid DNA-binding protein
VKLSDNFTRRDLAHCVSERLNLSVARAYKIVDVMLNSVTAALYNRQRVEFRDFGVFEVVTRKPKIGRNPKKPRDCQYLIPECRVVKFKMGKAFSDLLNV